MADDELTPAQAEAIRRLLAGARLEEPLPDDVAARLDERLAGLVDERGGAPVVVPLRRRPGRLPKALMAAAAVAVVGYGTAVVAFNTTEEDSSDAGVSSTTRDEAGGGAESGVGVEPTPQAPYADVPGTVADQLASLPRVRPDHVRQDLRRLTSQQATAPRSPAAATTVPACGPLHSAAGEQRHLASYAGRLVLVLGYPPEDGVRRVEMFECQGTEPRQAVVSVTFDAEE